MLDLNIISYIVSRLMGLNSIQFAVSAAIDYISRTYRGIYSRFPAPARMACGVKLRFEQNNTPSSAIVATTKGGQRNVYRKWP